MPKGMRGFQPKASGLWNGNVNGRTPSYKEKFYKEIFDKHKGDIKAGIEIFFQQVYKAEPWAIKDLLDHFLPKTDVDLDIMIHDNSNEPTKEEMAQLSSGLLMDYRQVNERVVKEIQDIRERTNNNGQRLMEENKNDR